MKSFGIIIDLCVRNNDYIRDIILFFDIGRVGVEWWYFISN